eukprot:CAMPEP_0183377126 /NCGR_PEP_ID=MMETSP0164_2-20130417/122204_1 /TAXON_ID=221442 /ORGANISM="Coccolithus pelagicus ssp braarudi, Strain PLY182g" /LENGTH=66 /DNA_ID=CAMNT_0025554543 /DNA_START=114 /DNA_END=310 /DNA_ORIENTATION=-
MLMYSGRGGNDTQKDLARRSIDVVVPRSAPPRSPPGAPSSTLPGPMLFPGPPCWLGRLAEAEAGAG